MKNKVAVEDHDWKQFWFSNLHFQRKYVGNEPSLRPVFQVPDPPFRAF